MKALALCLAVVTANAAASSYVVGLDYSKNAEKPVAIHEVENVDASRSCSHRIADVVVDEVVYEGASSIIVGFRAKKPAPKEWYDLFRFTSSAYENLSNSNRHYVAEVVKKGQRVIVVYDVCGSGGFIYIKELFKKTAVNNP